MTDTAGAGPQQQPDLLSLSDAQAAALLVAELAAADAASWPLRYALAQIRTQLAGRRQLAAALGHEQAVTDLRTWTRQQLLDVTALLDGPAVRQVLHQAAQSAAAAGAANAVAHVRQQTERAAASTETAAAEPATPGAAAAVAPTTTGNAIEAAQAVQAGVIPAVTPRLEPPVVAVIRTAPATAAAHLQQAVQALSGAQDIADVEQALTVADRAPESLSLAASWAVNAAANDSVTATAVRLGAELLWIAERDACVVCTALAGHTANPAVGEGFDEFATFGKPSSAPDIWPPGMPLMRPPRHPRCRCMVVVWLGTAPGQPDLPARLRHEARRSILRGFSRPSESHHARLEAASRLLGTGAADMPKSVRQYAAHAVAAGHFPTREVPRYPSAPRRAA